jgi:hypothetical protein
VRIRAKLTEAASGVGSCMASAWHALSTVDARAAELFWWWARGIDVGATGFASAGDSAARATLSAGSTRKTPPVAATRRGLAPAGRSGKNSAPGCM